MGKEKMVQIGKERTSSSYNLSSDSVNFHNCFGPGSLSLGFSELNGIMKLPIMGIPLSTCQAAYKIEGDKWKFVYPPGNYQQKHLKMDGLKSRPRPIFRGHCCYFR